MRIFAVLLISLGLIGSAHARVVENPTDTEIEYLYRYLAGDPPNFEAEARTTQEFYQADEFDRQQVIDQMQDRLRAQYQASGEIEAIRIRTQGRFGEYNTDIGGFQFDLFRPGIFFPFGRYGLTMENAEEFRDWTLSVDEARTIRNQERFGQVIFEIDVRPFATSPTRSRTIRGQIVGLKVYLGSNNQLVLDRRLDAGAMAQISDPSARASTQALSNEQVSLRGLTIGMSEREVQSWVQQNSFQSGEFGRWTRFATNDEAMEYGATARGFRDMLFNSSGDAPELSIFGPGLNCRAEGQQFETCGLYSLDDSDTLQSAILLQTVSGQTRQQIVDALIARYGEPTDRMDVQLLGRFQGQQYMWGVSSTQLRDIAFDLTNVSGATHWQVEAALTEPTPGRIAVFVQINRIADGSGEGGSARF